MASTSTATHPISDICPGFGIISLLYFHFLAACACEPVDANATVTPPPHREASLQASKQASKQAAS